MNELLERERSAILVECPWCDGLVELVAGSTAIVCDGCRLTLELAPDVPTMGVWTKVLSATGS